MRNLPIRCQSDAIAGSAWSGPIRASIPKRVPVPRATTIDDWDEYLSSLFRLRLDTYHEQGGRLIAHVLAGKAGVRLPSPWRRKGRVLHATEKHNVRRTRDLGNRDRRRRHRVGRRRPWPRQKSNHRERGAGDRPSLVVGELTLNILPVPTVSIKNAVLGNAAWGNAPQLAKVGEISARLALLPLLFGQHVRVTRLRMSDVDLFLETDAHGRGNWAFGDMTGKSPGQASPLPGGTAEPQPIIAGDIEVDDLAISYRDSRGAAVSRVSLDSIKLTGNATSTAFSFGLKIDGNGLAASPVAASERLSSVEYHLAATVSGDPEGSIQLKSIHGSFGPSSFDGEASVVLTGPRPTLTAKFDVPMIDLTQNQTIDQTAPAGPTAKSGQDRLFAGDPLILPLDALAPFDGDLILNVVTVKFRHATLDHIVAHADSSPMAISRSRHFR